MAGGGFKDGSIVLQENPAIYYPGQTINGSVNFSMNQPLKSCVLYIQFVGKASVVWFTNEFDADGMTRYQSDEEYFDYSQNLTDGQTELPGTYQSYPFKFQIPFKCPSSFKGKKGNVRYKIIATMVYPDKKGEVLEQEFKVVSPLDLNTGNPALKNPVHLELEECNPCNWCFDSGYVNVKVRLPVTGYCPGQTIPIKVDVDNQSSVEITGLLFELTTKERYRSTQPPSEFVVPDKVLSSVKKGFILSNTKKEFTCDLIVPDIVVPYMEHCSIIDVGYFFKATMSLSGCNDDIQEESEICLGLVPLVETQKGEYKHPMAHTLPSGPIPVYDEATAPVYESQKNSSQSQPNLNQSAFQTSPLSILNNLDGMFKMLDDTFRNSTGNLGFRTETMSSSNVTPGVNATGSSKTITVRVNVNGATSSYSEVSFAPSAPPNVD